MRLLPALALLALGLLDAADPSAALARAVPAAEAYHCQEPVQVGVAGQTVTSPRICVPAP